MVKGLIHAGIVAEAWRIFQQNNDDIGLGGLKKERPQCVGAHSGGTVIETTNRVRCGSAVQVWPQAEGAGKFCATCTSWTGRRGLRIYLTDLLTVYFGAGIFTANAAFQFGQWQSHSHHGWRASRQGYLSEPLYGYALAAFSWYRGDLKAEWRKYLRQNIEYYFSDSMHFLTTTSETGLPFNGA